MKEMGSELHPSRAVARRMFELETELNRARAYQRRHSKSPETTGRWGLELPASAQQEEGWFVTYLDMMTLLLVVMIVMLAFSGLPGKVNTNTVHLPEAAESVAVVNRPKPSTEASSTTLGAVPDGIAETAPPAAPGTLPGGTGLLPGGAGLLPGAAGMLPEADALQTLPLPLNAPSDDLASAEAPGNPVPAAPEATKSISDLYPGYSADDLAASLIGPRRPAATDVAGHHPLGLPPLRSSNASADPPTEGEQLASGLSLGDLGNDVEIVVNERSVSFRVNSEILFDSSQADLSRSGLGVLRRIAKVLSSTPHEVTVEGHTDAVPVRRNVRYPSNWELSSARAGSVVRYLQANGIDRGRLKAVGYADTRAIADNHSPAGRAQNRRVELVIEKRKP